MNQDAKDLTGYPSVDRPWLKYYTEEEQNYTIPEMKIVEHMYQYTRSYNDEIALEYMKKKISYRAMRERIELTACALKELGVAEGDMVSICLPNIPEVVYLFYAVNKVGAVANMLDPRNSNTEILRLLKEVNTKWLFAMDTALRKFSDVLGQANLNCIVGISVLESLSFPIRKIALWKEASLRVDWDELKKTLCNEKLLQWKEFEILGREMSGVKTAEYRKDAPAVICYTGGSTGVPKGAVMSDYNFNAYIVGVLRTHYSARVGDRVMIVAPPWNMYGISNSINAYLSMGLHLLLFPISGQEMFGKQVIDNMPNHILANPSALKGLMNYSGAQKADLSYLKTIILGAEKLDIPFEEEANRWLADHGCRIQITKGYGMTELGAAVCYAEGASNLPGTVGVPYVTDVVTVFNEIDGAYVEGKYDEQGEICVLSPKCMLGYAGTGAEQTGMVLKRHADGTVWAHTGDMGHLDENGCVYIDGRIKRMIIRDGYKVFPAAIEQVASQHPNVKDCAVVGIKDSAMGYVAKAYLVLRDQADKDNTIESVRSLCREKLYDYEVPDYFEVIEELPLTGAGKVDYRELEESNK